MTSRRMLAGLLAVALLTMALATLGWPLMRNILFGLAYEIDGN
ncbi:hypothetical protein SH591_13960 [Sphingomonas sp. LY54]|nr:hypothetical protein [Sphingomonas sp. LY54]WRP28192.1 hypothetical protein SH591_13960 [Sphingomonas sp. LY54]